MNLKKILYNRSSHDTIRSSFQHKKASFRLKLAFLFHKRIVLRAIHR